jgi:SlyX protein
MPLSDPRLIQLEMRVAHQEKIISELNDVVTAQWKRMETMERQLRRFSEELAELGSGDAPPANQRPPHY